MSTSPIADEILRKKIECSEQNYTLETVFINPTDLISLLIDFRFKNPAYYTRGKSALERGEIGEFLGIKIIVSNNVPLHKLLFSVNLGGYRSVQGPAWDKDLKADELINPSRRDS
jgi:hypothetical protein